MIEQMLTISTAHIRPETCNEWLPNYDGPVWDKGEFGWFVYVPDDDLATHLPAIPDDLAKVFEECRKQDVHWVMFDRDATEVNELPTYDWGE